MSAVSRSPKPGSRQGRQGHVCQDLHWVAPLEIPRPYPHEAVTRQQYSGDNVSKVPRHATPKMQMCHFGCEQTSLRGPEYISRPLESSMTSSKRW